MALRNQPYIKMFPKDWLSDEKLKECNAESHGVYFNVMLLMHQSQKYGVILLKQKYKQDSSKVKNFATQFAQQLSFSAEEIERGLTQLINEDVLQLNGERLSQKRMVKDGKLSDTRAEAGSKGGTSKAENDKNARDFANGFAKAKNVANYDYEYVPDNDNENDNKNRLNGVAEIASLAREIVEYLNQKAGTRYQSKTKATQQKIKARINEGYTLDDFKTVIDKKVDQWMNTEWENFLRPETLFGNKFEGYLNQKTNKKRSSNPYLDMEVED